MKPEERYSSAKALAAEVENWLADEPVRAYREPFSARLGRWGRRHKPVVAGSVALLLTAVVALSLSTWLISREKEQKHIALVTRDAHIKNLNNNQQSLYQIRQQSLRYFRSGEAAQAAMEQLSTSLSQDQRLLQPEHQPLRTELTQRLLDYWDTAINLQDNPSLELADEFVLSGADWPGALLRLRRARLLALVGEHARAAVEAEALGKSEQPDPAWPYRLACVYALCAAAAKDDGKLAASYADRAMSRLRQAADAEFFREPDRANRLSDDRDLEVLRPREEFQRLLLLQGSEYVLACQSALAAAAVKHNAELAAKHADRAMQRLRALATKGYFKHPESIERLRKDSQLDFLRLREDFQKLIKDSESETRPERK